MVGRRILLSMPNTHLTHGIYDQQSAVEQCGGDL
jgi:hypothetical protein